MIRYTLLAIVVSGIIVYAFRDWYKSLCALTAMLAVLERHDMPRSMFNIVGANPWNLMMAFILMSWFLHRKAEELRWDMPARINVLLILYLLVVLVSFLRMAGDFEPVLEFYRLLGTVLPTVQGEFIDHVINGLKYVIPGLLIYHGCNSKSRFNFMLAAILIATFLLGLQIVRTMLPTLLFDPEDMSTRALRVLDRDIGLHRVDLAALMAGSTWAFFIARLHVAKKWRIWFVAASAMLLLALALTGGRMGYVTWFALALVIGFVRWKRYLVLGPAVLILAVSVVPQARERMLQGFSGTDSVSAVSTGEEVDLRAVTSDRTLIWPTLIGKIGEAPLFGYGKEGIFRSGASRELIAEFGGAGTFPHPHNAYIELLLDNGLIMGVPVLIFFWITIRRSVSLFRDDTSTVYVVAGSLCFLYVSSQLIASMGSQSFYPRAGVALMWCTIGLMFRVYRERERVRASATDVESLSNSESFPWQESPTVPAGIRARQRGRARKARAGA